MTKIEANFRITPEGDKNLLFYCLLHFIRKNCLIFNEKPTINLSRNEISTFIRNTGILINGTLTNEPRTLLKSGDVVKIPQNQIIFKCMQDSADADQNNLDNKSKGIESKQKQDELISTEIAEYISKYFEISEIDNLIMEDAKIDFFRCYSVIRHFDFEVMSKLNEGRLLIDTLIKILKQKTKLTQDLEIQQSHFFVKKDLFELIEYRLKKKIEEFSQLISDLEHGAYDNVPYNFLKDYNQFFNNPTFQYLIVPQIKRSLSGKAIIQALIKPVVDARLLNDLDEKFTYYENNKEIYDNFFTEIDENNDFDIWYLRIAYYFLNSLKVSCETYSPSNGEIRIEPLTRKYNFINESREYFDILLKINNIGKGLAREIILNSNTQNFIFENFSVGNLRPGETRDISIPTMVIVTPNFNPSIKITCIWKNTNGQASQITSDVEFELQKKEVPWDELEIKKPYTILAIEEKEKLFGRDQLLNELRKNILSNNIESYKLWGQKRVGKSSIVKTLNSLFNENEKIISIYRSIGGLKNTDPEKTLNTIGSSLCSEIFNEIDRKIQNSLIREKLKSIAVPEFSGSLFPLEEYITKLKRIDIELKFVFILDEFDRINDEFFLPGKLGDTLSLNIGKGINELRYVGFILVGSENMHLLDRQGINYNSYQEREVDTFDKEKQYDSYKKIITEPVSPYFEFNNEAVDLIFNMTNGNPYFTNLICVEIFKSALKDKDYEVDFPLAKKAIETIITSSQKSHFEHFWSDGISEESNIKKEKKSDIRRRILVSYSFFYYQKKDFPTRKDLLTYFNRPTEYRIENYEIENTIKEFINRKVFFEDSTYKIRIVPTLFESWLCGPGRILMIEGVSDLESLHREQEQEEEYLLKDHEINRIIENYRYKEEKLSAIHVKKYFNQFGGPIQQRRVFKLIDTLNFLSKQDIIDFFKREQKAIFHKSDIELKMGAKTIYRDGIELYSFPKSIKENIEIAESFKLYSHIRSTKTLKDIVSQKDSWKQSNAKDIIIFETVIDDAISVIPNLKSFMDDIIQKNQIPVKLLVLAITNQAKAEIIKATSSIKNFKLIKCIEYEESKIKPFIEFNEIFETREEASFAFSEVRKHFNFVNTTALNFVTEFICPSKSIPILWCKTPQFNPLFPNEISEIPIEISNGNEGENRRLRVFQANTELSQKINKFIIEYLKKKASTDNSTEWFSVKYIPKKILVDVHERYVEEDQTSPIESYFNFSDYKSIISKDSYPSGHERLL